ncbi:MAG TPA: ABC transporter ATP-binding protein [Bacilli bacterium]|nr:ABC transporter ATP-binding protein [Bacilli bacterium]
MIKLLKRLGKKEWLLVLCSTIFIIGQVYLDLKLPDYMTEITTFLQQKGSTIKDVLIPGSKMILCALGSLTSSFIVGYFAATIASTLSKTIRKDVFQKVLDFGMEEINRFSTGSLITRTTNDITQIQTVISIGLQLIIKAPILAVWAIYKIAGKAWQWSLATGIATLVLLTLITILVTLVMPKFKKIQSLTDNLNKITRENLTGIRVIRAFNAESYQENKFNEANNELTNTNLFTQRLMASMSPIMNLVMSGLTLSIYFIGAYLIEAANLMDKINVFSNMVVFSAYAMQVVMAFMMLAMIFFIYPRASVSAKRILEVLNTNINIKNGKISKDITKETGTIEFVDVSFRYPDAEECMLENISFKINKGEIVAFIGSTGSGKSTLINLIPRFYDVTSGTILVDGVDIREYNQEYLYSKLGYIPQKAVMFSGTVGYNISYGAKKNIQKNKIIESLKVAQGYDFVSKMPEKLKSHIAQGGTNISGGQKQRLAIARAITKNPEIYIFDDSFSALDYKTDLSLRKELKQYTKDATILIVAQRIGTIINADKIVVLENGKMVGLGKHKDLLKTCQVYKEIALSQLSKEELENA